MKQKLKHVSFIFIKLIALVAIVFAIQKFVFGFHVVDNYNMRPNINPSDFLIFYKLKDKILTNDIVLVNKSNKVFRVLALQGDKIEVHNNYLYINDKGICRVDDDFSIKNYILKKDEIFIMNDNVDDKNDSRSFGLIKEKMIIGKLIFRLQIRGF